MALFDFLPPSCPTPQGAWQCHSHLHAARVVPARRNVEANADFSRTTVTGDALAAFPVMHAIAARPDLVAAQPMRGLGAILLLHLRRSAAATAEVLIRLGMDPKDMLCIGKDYRYPDRGDTEARLRDLGIATSSIANLREALAGFSVRGDKPFIVLEDGGHVATEVYRDAALLARCRGIVEQTTKGDWRVRDAVTEFRVPHLSLPRSVIKREFECDSVGQAVQSSITALVAGHTDLLGLKVGVIGSAGTIGAAVAQAFRVAGSRVAVFDRAPPRYYALKCHGHFELCATREELLADRDLIIGCTGSPVLGVGDLKRLKDGVILASSGSEQTEFPLDALEQLSVSVTPFHPPGALAPHGLVYRLRPDGREVIVLEDGRPVNLGLAGPQYESKCFDLIMGLICGGAVEIACGRYAGQVGFIDDFDAIAERSDFEALYIMLHQGDLK